MYGSVYQCLDHSVTRCIQPYNIIIIITVIIQWYLISYFEVYNTVGHFVITRNVCYIKSSLHAILRNMNEFAVLSCLFILKTFTKTTIYTLYSLYMSYRY